MSGSGLQRTVSFTIAVTLHILAVVWLLIARPVPTLRHESLSEFNLEAVAMPAARAPAQRLSPPPMPTPQKRPFARPVAMTTGDSERGSMDQDIDGICSPVDVIAKSIMGDANVLAALGAVPKNDRSISEVIVIWNAGWSAATTGDDALLAPLRENIVRVLDGLPRNCLAEPVAGPRLVQIPTDRGTTFLAIGSGSWNWNQLLDYDLQSPTTALPALK
jgi:hypothetical protein